MTAPEGSFGRRSLDPTQLAATIERLSRRCDIRFPDSGLSTICRNLLDIARRTAETAAWIDRPLVPLRIAIALLLVVIAAGVAVTVSAIRTPTAPLLLTDLIQLIESGVNDLVFVAIGVFFLVSLEMRIKRRRALRAIHELRSIAHVIDMHQLTKDPELVLHRGQATGVVTRLSRKIWQKLTILYSIDEKDLVPPNL